MSSADSVLNWPGMSCWQTSSQSQPRRPFSAEWKASHANLIKRCIVFHREDCRCCEIIIQSLGKLPDFTSSLCIVFIRGRNKRRHCVTQDHTIIIGAGWEVKFLFYRKFQLVNILSHQVLEQNMLALQPFWQKWNNLFLCQLTSLGSQEANWAVGLMPGSWIASQLSYCKKPVWPAATARSWLELL